MKRALTLFALLATPALAVDSAQYVGNKGADPVAVARIHGGIVDCPGCKLMGANLYNTCVKERDLRGANFDGANAQMMCISFADFRGASFRGTELSAANLAGAKMDGADLTGAITSITSFLGTGPAPGQGPDAEAARHGLQRQGDKAAAGPEAALLSVTPICRPRRQAR